jgi:hypothetical protein
MGIFVLPPYAKIPLHDHPDMCVLSRVLYGDLERMSLDLVAHENNKASSTISYPPGTKRARQQHVDYLQAPQVTVLYPLEGNLHEFRAGPNGAAVLDVLLPPYNNSRDCTFYHVYPALDESDNGQEVFYYIIPTGQPEDFHCISGQYQDIGSI